MKKILKAIIVFFTIVIFLIIGGYYVLLHIFDDMCENQIYNTISSPDSKHKAVLFQRDCGATTDFSTQVSILQIDSSLNNESGNVLVVKGHPSNNNINIRWISENALEITNVKNASVYKKEASIDNIKVVYN